MNEKSKNETESDEPRPKTDCVTTSGASNVTSENASKLFRELDAIGNGVRVVIEEHKENFETFLNGVRQMKAEHGKFAAALKGIREANKNFKTYQTFFAHMEGHLEKAGF